MARTRPQGGRWRWKGEFVDLAMIAAIVGGVFGASLISRAAQVDLRIAAEQVVLPEMDPGAAGLFDSFEVDDLRLSHFDQIFLEGVPRTRLDNKADGKKAAGKKAEWARQTIAGTKFESCRVDVRSGMRVNEIAGRFSVRLGVETPEDSRDIFTIRLAKVAVPARLLASSMDMTVLSCQPRDAGNAAPLAVEFATTGGHSTIEASLGENAAVVFATPRGHRIVNNDRIALSGVPDFGVLAADGRTMRSAILSVDLNSYGDTSGPQAIAGRGDRIELRGASDVTVTNLAVGRSPAVDSPDIGPHIGLGLRATVREIRIGEGTAQRMIRGPTVLDGVIASALGRGILAASVLIPLLDLFRHLWKRRSTGDA